MLEICLRHAPQHEKHHFTIFESITFKCRASVDQRISHDWRRSTQQYGSRWRVSQHMRINKHHGYNLHFWPWHCQRTNKRKQKNRLLREIGFLWYTCLCRDEFVISLENMLCVATIWRCSHDTRKDKREAKTKKQYQLYFVSCAHWNLWYRMNIHVHAFGNSVRHVATLPITGHSIALVTKISWKSFVCRPADVIKFAHPLPSPNWWNSNVALEYPSFPNVHVRMSFGATDRWICHSNHTHKLYSIVVLDRTAWGWLFGLWLIHIVY